MVPCKFILGSAAEVERLWSRAKHVYTDSRSCLYPITFEAILFLKTNHDLWDIADVREAMEMAFEERKDDRLARKLEANRIEENSSHF